MQGSLLDDYLKNLLYEIEDLKSRNRHNLYRISETVLPETIEKIKNHFSLFPEYKIILKKCVQEENSWDILISF